MNINELSKRLADDAGTIAQYLLPNGKRVSGEWKAGSTSGEAGKSLGVRLAGPKSGLWKDFSTGEGGDLIDLWSCVRGLTIAQAMIEAKDFLGIREAQPTKQREYKRPTKPVCQTPKKRVHEWLLSRGLTEQTIADFKIGEQLVSGKAYAVFPFIRNGELVNVKYRNPDDKKDMRQEGGAEPCLFGWHLVDPKAREIAICEGEIDAMTLHQCGVPALSVNAGAGNHQWIESDWELLERFSTIYVMFDMDEPGQKGAAEVIKRLGLERCKRVSLPAKDANDYLLEGATSQEFMDCVKTAKFQDPEELVGAKSFMDKVKAMFYPMHDDIHDPVLRLDQDLDWFEFRQGELTVWTGFNGHGKSLMLSQVLLGLMAQEERVVVFSGEMTPERQLKRMVKQATGLDRPTAAYIDAVGDWVDDKFWLINVVGSSSIDKLLENFKYANKRYGARHFVIDSLMMTDVPEDGIGSMTAQKEAIRKMCDFAKRNGVHLHLVAHPRKSKDESGAPGKLDVAGSSKITDGADNVFSVWSARKDENEPVTDEPDAKLELQKQRNGEVQHFTKMLWFCKDAQQYTTNSRRRAVSYVPFSTVTAHA